MAEGDQTEAGALTFEEALEAAFAEEGVSSHIKSEYPWLYTDRKECPFKSIRLIIGQQVLRKYYDISNMEITEPFTVFPGIYRVEYSRREPGRMTRELYIPERHNTPPSRSFRWMFSELGVPEKVGSYDIIEKMSDFFNYLAGVGSHPNGTDLDFFDKRLSIDNKLFKRVIRIFNDPFGDYTANIVFYYYFRVSNAAGKGVIENLLSNLNNLSEAQMRQSENETLFQRYELRLVRASDHRVFYFEITINFRTPEEPYTIQFIKRQGAMYFNHTNDPAIEDRMSKEGSIRNGDSSDDNGGANNGGANNGGDDNGGANNGGGAGVPAVGSSMVSDTICKFNEKLTLRLSVALDELERSVNKL